MSEITEAAVRALLEPLDDPHTGMTLGEARAVRAVGIDADRVFVDLELAYPAAGWHEDLSALVKEALEADTRIAGASVSIGTRVRAHRVQPKLSPMGGVKNVIAVASGKGGVGKSTVAVNLALALRAEGARVGIMDADIYGPSQMRMLGIEGKPESPDGRKIIPRQAHDLQMMSIGLLVEEDTAMIWRGPMVTQALMQLLNETLWQDLDYLVVDLPPGTGDIHLTLCQRVPLAGAVIVTTPQDIALLDARKALKMFEKVEVPVLGVVENMATHICSQCGHEEHIFGAGGGERMAAQYDVPMLGALPLDIRIREQTDSGKPTVVAMPDSDIAGSYRAIARRTAALLSTRARNKSLGFPEIVVQNT